MRFNIFRLVVLVAIAHVEIWMRLQDMKSKYQIKVVNNKNMRQDITKTMRHDLHDIQRMLCLLNKKASSEGPLLLFVSNSLTNRLIISYLVESKDIGIQHSLEKGINNCKLAQPFKRSYKVN